MGTGHESAERLREEILEQGRKESDEILRRASEEAARLLAAASDESRRMFDEIIDAGRAEALRRREVIEATIAVETGRLYTGRVESLLQSLREAARQRLMSRDGLPYRDILAGLAARAIGRMSGQAFVLTFSESDRPLLDDGFLEEVARRVGRPGLHITYSFDSAIVAGGVCIETADSSQIWDNGLLSRLERMWPELRRQVAVEASLVQTSPSEGGSQ